MLPVRTVLDRQLRRGIVVLAIVCLAGCAPASSLPPAASTIPATVGRQSVDTAGNAESPTPMPPIVSTAPAVSSPPLETAASVQSPTSAPLPSALPGPTGTPPSLPRPEFVAIVLEKGVPPPDRSAHGWGEGNIEIYQPPRTEPVFRLLQEGVSYDQPAFSPDGRWLAYVEDRKDPATGEGQARVRVVSTDWQTDRPVTDWFRTYRDVVWLLSLLWSADSRWLAFQHYNKASWSEAMYVVSTDTGEVRLVGDPVYNLAWSPQDPSLLAFIMGQPGSPPGLYLASIDDLEHPQKVDIPGTPVFLSWRPDGKQLAACSGDWYLWIVDTATLSTEEIRLSSTCAEFLWSPDGQWLASYTREYRQDGVTFFKAGQWTAIRLSLSGPIVSGIWAGNEFFLGDEWLRDNSGGLIGHQLVAISVQGPAKYILWDPEEVGLPDRIRGKFRLEAIVWYVSVQP